MTELHVFPTREDAADAAAQFLASLSEQRVRTQGRFTIALSGGSTPRSLYQLLASPPYAERIAWDRWHVFWGDERCVPPDHSDSNYRMAREALLERVPIPADHVHRVRGEIAPEDAATEYEEDLRRLFQMSRPVFDLVLLGLGEDGHTASLFPGTRALREERRLVVANWVPALRAFRVTFTLPLINAARFVAFLCWDESKTAAVRRALAPAPGDATPPAALVRPDRGTTHWFLTTAAAGQLPR